MFGIQFGENEFPARPTFIQSCFEGIVLESGLELHYPRFWQEGPH